MTEQQALLKLTTLCTQAEHCSQEMLVTQMVKDLVYQIFNATVANW